MEGEPVRRHVADLMQQYNKPVYGLFIANRIDSNTAETFRIGVWYTRDDVRLNLHIVPFTLMQFSTFFKAIALTMLISCSKLTPPNSTSYFIFAPFLIICYRVLIL